jgi:uncharacterized membrane protein YGL010W
MSSGWNWFGAILLVIAFALILSGVIYIESTGAVDSTFKVLLGFGITLLLIGFIVLFFGHYYVLFPQTIDKLPTTFLF